MYNYYKVNGSVVEIHERHRDRIIAPGKDVFTGAVDQWAVLNLTEITVDEALAYMRKCYENALHELCNQLITPAKITAVENLDHLIYNHLSIVYEPITNTTRVGYVSNHFIENDILNIIFIDIINNLKIEYLINHEVDTTPVLLVHAPLGLEVASNLTDTFRGATPKVKPLTAELMQGVINNTIVLAVKDGDTVREFFTGNELNPGRLPSPILPHQIITKVIEYYSDRIFQFNSQRLTGELITPEMLKERDLTGVFVGFTGEHSPEKTGVFDTPVKCDTFMGYVKEVKFVKDVPYIVINDEYTKLEVTIPVIPGIFLVM